MTAHPPMVLAIEAALDPLIYIVIMVGYGVLRWYWKSVKRASGQGGAPPRSGPMGGQSAASRQEELRRLREQNLGGPGLPAKTPSSNQEKTARELAREVYQQRAEALRAQMSGGSRSTTSQAAPGVRQVAQIATLRPTGMAPVKVGPGGVSPVRVAPSMGTNRAAPIARAERGAGNVAVRRVGPVAPARQAGQKPAARGAAAPAESWVAAGTLQRSIAAKAAALKKRDSAVDEDALTSVPVIRAIGKRPAILLMRDSMREAVMLREVLDRPLALRDSAAPF